jgi:hypothetical protein
MQLVLAIFLLLFLAGLLWSLWFVLTNPRRRARQIAAELSAPATRTSTPLSVGHRRWVSGGVAAWFAVLALDVIVREHDALAAVLLFALFAIPAIYYARNAMSAKTVLIIDGDGIVVTNPARHLRWNDIETIAIEERSGTFGIEEQDLVLHLPSYSVEPPEHHLRGLVTRAHDKVVTRSTFCPLAGPRSLWRSATDQVDDPPSQRSTRPSGCRPCHRALSLGAKRSRLAV